MYKYIIWDFDGTLFNTYPEISKVFKNTLMKFNIEEGADEILRNLHKSLSYTIKHYAKKHNLSEDELRKSFVIDEEAMDVKDVYPFEGSKQLLEHIKGNGGKNFIVTNRGKSTFNFLKHTDFIKYFDEIITREDGFEKKPSPQSLLHLIKKYKLESSKTLFIGDRDLDLMCAKNAKVKCCFFNSHSITTKIKVDYTVESIEDLLKLFA